MASEGVPFEGVLFAGFLLTSSGPALLEFNCRFGDPETQALLPLLSSDLFPILLACSHHSLPSASPEALVRWKKASSCCVVLAAEGYPGPQKQGDEVLITPPGPQKADEAVFVYHAGTG